MSMLDEQCHSLGLEDQSVMQRYFKHQPQSTQKQSVIASTATARPKSILSLGKDAKTERVVFPKKKRPFKLESMNKEQIESLRIEDIQTWVWQLPITLTEMPEDTKSYFTGCSELHKHNYETAKKLFKQGLSQKINENSKQIMTFNLAYSQYKLKENPNEYMKLWREQIQDTYYKTLAQFNLAVVTFYNNLAHPEKAVTLDHVSETMSHFDFTMAQINQMMNSFLEPNSQQILQIPSWLNLDQLINTCKSLFHRLKPKVEALPP